MSIETAGNDPEREKVTVEDVTTFVAKLQQKYPKSDSLTHSIAQVMSGLNENKDYTPWHAMSALKNIDRNLEPKF